MKAHEDGQCSKDKPFLPGLPAQPAERTRVPALCCWQDGSLHPLCHGSLFTLRAPLAPARYWGSQHDYSVGCRCPHLAPAHSFWDAELVMAKFLDTGGLYSSVNQDAAMDSLRAFRGSALDFLAMIFTHDDLFLPL